MLPRSSKSNLIKPGGSVGRALLLEDDFLIASDVEMKLERLGFDTIDVCSYIPQALQSISNTQYQFCVLDVNVHGKFSGSVAKALEVQSTPFVFVTGYDSQDVDLFSGFSVQVLTKPISYKQLELAYSKALQRG